MDFCPGGELFYHLHNLGRLTEEQARFYISEILIGLEHLHSLEIVYRDLKPENILLDLDGHIRITDFGLSKQFIKKDIKSYSFCGSPEYMSPEMLQGQGHGREVDFYSLGAMLYEMLTGLPPFYDSNRSKMYKNILTDELTVPSYISKLAKDLIQRLLDKVPGTRLGSIEGTLEIRSHPWFKGVSWSKVRDKKTIPPYRPNFRHSNFDPEYTNSPINLAEFDNAKISFDSIFSNFDYGSSGDIKADLFDTSTQSSRNINSVSQIVDEHNSTKLKVFMPSAAPKVFSIKDTPDSPSYLKHRRFKDMLPVLLPVDPSKTSRNLVQELRSPVLFKAPVKLRKKPKNLSQELMLPGTPQTCDDKVQEKEDSEFLQKVENSDS